MGKAHVIATAEVLSWLVIDPMEEVAMDRVSIEFRVHVKLSTGPRVQCGFGGVLFELFAAGRQGRQWEHHMVPQHGMRE